MLKSVFLRITVIELIDVLLILIIAFRIYQLNVLLKSKDLFIKLCIKYIVNLLNQGYLKNKNKKQHNTTTAK